MASSTKRRGLDTFADQDFREESLSSARLILSSSSFPPAIRHRNLDPRVSEGKSNTQFLISLLRIPFVGGNEEPFFIILRVLVKFSRSASAKMELVFALQRKNHRLS